MLTKTTEMAICVLVHLGLLQKKGLALETPVSLGPIAKTLDCSPTYLSKILAQLVKAGMLKSVRGTRGGVYLARETRKITLLEIIENCQGVILEPVVDTRPEQMKAVCAFHLALIQVREENVKVLSSFTLADLVERPGGNLVGEDHKMCNTGVAIPVEDRVWAKP